MERIIITDSVASRFDALLQNRLNEGWNITPHTLVVGNDGKGRNFVVVERNKPAAPITVLPQPPNLVMQRNPKGQYTKEGVKLYCAKLSAAMGKFNLTTEKIAAIKWFRDQVPGLGLAEAKYAIEHPVEAMRKVKETSIPQS